mgnify:CR=1 FL=1
MKIPIKNANPVGKAFEKRLQLQPVKLGDGFIRIFSAKVFDNFCMEALKKNPDAFVDRNVK